jgi:hypothetical protein|nr:MAG TPA: YopX protein [Caudoviricetes sp.]
MNNLKFRVWDKKLKLLGDVSNIDFDIKSLIYFSDKNAEFYANFEDAEIMQSTGFNDKNKKEIFIGDIVKFPELYEFVDGAGETTDVTVCDGFNIASVVKKGSYITLDNFVYEDGGTPSGLENNDFTFDDLDFKNFEIIGNIYENKELLENE